MIWSLDQNGNYGTNLIGAVSGSSTALQQYKTLFGQNLNDNGMIGSTPTPSYTVPSGIRTVQLVGTAAQTVTANNHDHLNDYGSTLIGGTGNDTFVAGHSSDTLTGGAGSDRFVFGELPWNAGHITDFNPASDVIDLAGIFGAIGYSGSNPFADSYLSVGTDGAGNPKIFVHPEVPATTIPVTVTTLDHVLPAQITSGDWVSSCLRL